MAPPYGPAMGSSKRIATNRLLDALPAHERRRVLAGSETVDLAFADVIYVPGAVLAHVYFPLEALISLIVPIEGSAGLEVGLVGNEGMFGIPLVLGVDVSSLQAVVQGSGAALRMDAAPFGIEIQRNETLHRLIDRYAFVHLSELAQTAGCTRYHVVEARLARWLLMTQDRVHSARVSRHSGIPRVDAGCATGRCDPRRRVAAEARIDSLQPRQHHGSRSTRAQGRRMCLLRRRSRRLRAYIRLIGLAPSGEGVF